MAVNPYDGAGYGCGIGYGYCGTPASAALDIRAAVGTSTSPTSTGTKAVTGVGFQPKAIVPFGVLNSSQGVSNACNIGFGACDESSQAAIAVASTNGVTTSVTSRTHTNVQVYRNVETAEYSSFDSDGFTLNWLGTLNGRILNHIALGGADLEVSLTQHQMNATNADESFAHGLSGAPTGVVFISAINNAAPPSTTTQGQMSIGAWSSSSQFCAATFHRDGVTTTTTKRVLKNTCVVADLDIISTQREMAVASVDATNVNVTYPVTSASQWRFFMLAIRGAKVQTGTFDCNGSTDPLTISCTGITPKLWLGIGLPLGVDNVNTVLNNAALCITASDGTNTTSCGVTDANGVTTTNARRWQSSTTFAEYEIGGSKQFEADVSFDGESVVVDPTTNASASYGQGSYLIIGA